MGYWGYRGHKGGKRGHLIMDMDLLKQLFYELFDVNHLMNDLINELEETDIGYEFLQGFYIGNIQDEFTRESIIEHKESYSVSCLGGLSAEALDEFLDDVFKE